LQPNRGRFKGVLTGRLGGPVRLRAFSLAYVLMLCSLAFLFLSLVFNASMQSYQRAVRQPRYRQARLLARTAAAQAVAQLRSSASWNSTLALGPLPGQPDDASADVHFDSTRPWWSCNNLAGNVSVLGFNGTVVPAYVADLWSSDLRWSARLYGTQVSTPPYPFAVASAAHW